MRYLVPLLMLLPLYPVDSTAQEEVPEPPVVRDTIVPPQTIAFVPPIVAKVDGPPSGRVGDLLSFAADIEASSYKWILLPEGLGKLVTFPDGKKAVFATHDPGEYMIVLAVANKAGQVDVTFHPLMIGQALVAPQSPEPQAQAQTAQVTYLQLAQQLASQLPKEQRQRVATVIRQAQGLIEPGNVETYTELKELTEDLIRRDNSVDYQTWKTFLDRVYQTLPDMQLKQAGSVWLEIARGLEQ